MKPVHPNSEYANRLTNQYATGASATFTLAGVGQVYSYFYDVNGNTTAIEDYLGNIMTMSYDCENRMIAQVLPSGLVATYVYVWSKKIMFWKQIGFGISFALFVCVLYAVSTKTYSLEACTHTGISGLAISFLNLIGVLVGAVFFRYKPSGILAYIFGSSAGMVWFAGSFLLAAISLCIVWAFICRPISYQIWSVFISFAFATFCFTVVVVLRAS